MRPTFAGDPQPHSSASETPRRIAPSATERSAAPSQSMRGRWPAGSGGMSRYAASAEGSAIRLIPNSQLVPSVSAITPDSDRPMPPPMPKIALIMPSPAGMRSRGNVSRTMPNARGKTPPAIPWITRPAMTTPIERPRTHTIAPHENSSRTAVRTRPLP